MNHYEWAHQNKLRSVGPLYGPHRLFSYYGLSWPVSKSLEHDYVRSGVSQPEIEGDIRSSVSLLSPFDFFRRLS